MTAPEKTVRDAKAITYLVRCRTRHSAEYLRETDLPYGDKECFDDFMRGRIEDPLAVFAANFEADKMTLEDVSQTYANDIYARFDEEGNFSEMPDETKRFCERYGKTDIDERQLEEEEQVARIERENERAALDIRGRYQWSSL